MRELPRADGSARLRARELRRGRRVARRDEGGTPVDASGALPDGTTFEGLAGLRTILLGTRASSSSAPSPRSCWPTRSAAASSTTTCRRVRRIVRDAARRRLPLVVDHPRHRQERAVSDAEDRIMIITKMALAAPHGAARPRRQRWRCRCSTAWCRRFGARRRPPPGRSRRFGVVYVPNGMVMQQLDAGARKAPASSSRRR